MPWSRWHWLIVVSLGATWILDGLEVTLAGALGGILTRPETLGLTPARVGATATCYLAGAVLGALLFGYGTDRFGRKKLFFITVAVYLIGTALSAFSWNFWSYAFFRAITGAGIGGEYAAINSAIDELIPARVRGRVDLIINGSYWIGAAMGAGATLVLLNPRYFPTWLGWRCAFGIGATLGLIVIFFRRWIPESPRWLMIHGRNDEAEQIVSDVERKIMGLNAAGITDPGYKEMPTRIRTRTHTPWREIWKAIVHEHRRRSFLGFVLMSTQAFFLQRDLLHVRARPDAVLPRARAKCGRVSPPVRVGKCARAIAPRTSVRHNRTQTNDYSHVRARRHLTRTDRLAFPCGRAHRTNADSCLDHYFFHRVGGSQFGVPDGERNFSARNPCGGNRNFLRDRNAGRRSRRARALRVDHRHRIDHGIVLGILVAAALM